MKTLKPYKVTSTGPLYKVRTPAQVNQKLIDAVGWKKEDKLICFDFRPMPLPAKPIKFKVSPNYDSRVACYSPGPGVKAAVKPCPPAGIESRPPSSLAELKRATEASFQAYLKERGKLVPPDVIKDYKDFKKNYIGKIKALLLLRKGKLVGLTAHMPSTGVLGDKQDLIVWRVFLAKLSPAELRSAHCQEALWLKATTKNRVAIVLNYYEKEAFKLFYSLGFTTRRAIFERIRPNN